MKIDFAITPQSLRDFQRAVDRLVERDAKIASTWALNDTAPKVVSHLQERMRLVFDRPTPFALNAFRIRGARPTDLTITVMERPSADRRHFLKVEEAGGARPQTGTERALQYNLKYGGAVSFGVPASGAKLNQYGNWQAGERNQAMSGVQARHDPKMNTTKESRKRYRKRAGYFVPREGSKLSKGIWKRDGGGDITKVMHFLDRAPRYTPLLGFYDGVEKVYRDELPKQIRRAFEKMIARRSK